MFGLPDIIVIALLGFIAWNVKQVGERLDQMLSILNKQDKGSGGQV